MTHTILSLVFGSVIGLALGLLGAGGSILTVPILVYILGMQVQTATGTSLAIVGLNSAAGAADYLRRGKSLPRTGVAFGVSGLAGALGGAWLNHFLAGSLILLLFSLVMVAAAVSLLRRTSAPQQDGSFSEAYSTSGWVKLAMVGLAIGFLTGFFGVGGGFLIVPALVLVVHLPMHLAVGTSLLAIALNALWGLLGHLRYGGLDWTTTGLFVAGGLLGVFGGGYLSSRLPEKRLRQGFAGVIIAVAAYTFIQSAMTLA